MVWIARKTTAHAVTLSAVPRGNHATSQTTKATLGLRELLLSGAFKPRERVPELRLVEELGVSRVTVNKRARELRERLRIAERAGEGELEEVSP